ncbi:hypothetical protein F5146DRAFT_530300 [Armillaria mellea]|nr:hypothetical protein F5146DRAFT_530300 [Armillaria mellea]
MWASATKLNGIPCIVPAFRVRRFSGDHGYLVDQVCSKPERSCLPDYLCRTPRHGGSRQHIGAAPTGAKTNGISTIYTIPIIENASAGAVVSDSATIAAYLDNTYYLFSASQPKRLAFNLLSLMRPSTVSCCPSFIRTWW